MPPKLDKNNKYKEVNDIYGSQTMEISNETNLDRQQRPAQHLALKCFS